MKKIIIFAVVALIAIGCKQKGNETNKGSVQTEISGAGATFPLPYYNVVFKNYTEETGNKVTYGGIGSGGGIRGLADKTVDFGASDAFLSDKELAEMPGEILHIPTCMGAVVLAYNLPGIDSLKLNGKLVADIFLGKIKKWNDPEIKKLNPNISLPNKSVTSVYRSDGSGTTFVFSDYLSKVDPEWAEKMGTGKSLNWTSGISAKGNPGVAGIIQQTQGAIGYIGSEYALSLGIPSAIMQNKAGNFVKASTESISAAANMELPKDMRTMITDSQEPSAYPISCFTWIIVYKEQSYANRKAEQAQGIVNLLNYMMSPKAQDIAPQVHYSPLPEAAVNNAKELIKSMTFNGESILK